MKKLLSILSIVVFFIAISVPAYSSIDSNTTIVQVVDEEPKKEEATKEAAKKDKKKSADCQAKAEKSGCDAKKEKSCGDKGKK
jgi:uncharacterized protein YxeA